MKTTDPNILKQFITVFNRQPLTEEIYNALLKRWNLDKVDLDHEMERINKKDSPLSRSRREAVPEFIKLREMLKNQKLKEQAAVSLNQTNEIPSLSEDQLTI